MVLGVLLLFPFSTVIAASHSSSTTSKALSNHGRSVGIGVILGEPTGLTLKAWTGRASALNFGLTYSFGSYFIFMTDYLWHFPEAFSQGRVGSQFVPYVGLGAEVFFGDSSPYYSRTRFRNSTFDSVAFGARIPLGIEFSPQGTPFGIFAEIVPGVGLLPGMFGFVQGGIGARVYL